jgi:hypothetical protein
VSATDPVADPAPRFNTQTLLAFGGWVAATAFAVAGLKADDERLRLQIAGAVRDQMAVDGAQDARLNRIEQKLDRQEETLLDICDALDCRQKVKGAR